MNGKIGILQFPIRASYGGITHYAFNNWKHLDKKKFACDFATVSKHLGFEKEITESGAGLHYISCYAEENREQFIEEMRVLLKNGKYDVVHLHTSFWKSFLVEEIALECKIPKIIVHSHSTHIDIEDDEARLAAETLHEQKKRAFNTSLATDFWACSSLAADWLFGPQIPREHIRVMKNAIDVKRYVYNCEVRDTYRRKLGLDGCFVLGHVGRFCYQKNHEFLLRVFAQVCSKMKNTCLLLAGSGPLEEAVRQQAQQLHISDKVVFLGSRMDVPQLLQAMDVFCLPSRFEGLGIVLVEAQSAGLKCLASDAVPDEAKITENLRFLPLTEEDWVQAALEIAKGYVRKDMYEEVTEAGYNIVKQVKTVEEFYQSGVFTEG